MSRPRNPEIDKLAKELAVSRRRANQIKSAGNGEESGNEMRVARLRKLDAEIAFLEERLAKLRREVISLTEAESYGMKIGQVVERFWDEGRTNWPTEHAGKTEIQLQILYDNASSEFKERLRATLASE